MNNQTAIQPTPEQVAVYAYLLWEKEGKPQGQHEAHWLQAEKQLMANLAHEAGLLRRTKTVTLVAQTETAPLRPKRRNNSKRQDVIVT